MIGKVSKADFVANVRERIGSSTTTMEQARDVIRHVIDEVRANILQGSAVNLHLLGTLKPRITTYRNKNQVSIKLIMSRELQSDVQDICEKLLEHRRLNPPRDNSANLQKFKEMKSQAKKDQDLLDS